jgi:3-hydroxybutyrate dehydrogenase
MTNLSIPQLFDLSGKSAVVSGGAMGIGKSIAERLSEAGAGVVIADIDAKSGQEAAKELSEKKRQVVFQKTDVSSLADIAQAIETAEKQFGGVDILVNNAGIQHVAPVDEFPPEKWDAIIAINLSSAFHAIRAVLPGMKSKKWGRIINIASAHGLVASPFKSAYVAAKHGMVGLTKVVALEVAHLGITCNAICPGYVKTPLVEGQIADQAKARKMTPEAVIKDVILAAQPTKKFVTVEELNALTIFLADDKAASINGASLSIDGGWTAQ